VLITRTPDGRLTFLQAIGSRRKGSVAAAIPPWFTGYLITDGSTGYQHLLSRLAGIQQCAQHVIRRCKAVTKLGPGSLQSWAADVITILRDAHAAVGQARARGDTALDQKILDDLLERYDTAAASGRTHNRLRDWDTGNHPGYALGCWLEQYREQRNGTRPSPATGIPWRRPPRWCRLRSYLDSAAAHGITALDAIASAIAGNPT
jgi:transposase